MNVKAKLNHKNISYVKKVANQVLVETADALKSDVQKSKTMPFDTGQLQNRSIFVDDSKKNSYAVAKAGITALLMDTEYNRDAKDLIRVHNWQEIYEYISNYKEEKLNVTLDTDIGNECDDQFAMSYLLK